MELDITPRDLRFAALADAVALWRAREPDAAAFYNSLSALFPRGERFFIDSVRAFRSSVSGPLADEVKAFVRQEAIHTREHLAFNAQVTVAGYDIGPLEARTRRQVEAMNTRPALVQLGLTVALEHITATLAHELLADPRHLASAPAETARLWRWHAIEEIEHKAVAFGTLLAATRQWSSARRWVFRSRLFAEAAGKLMQTIWLNLIDLRRQDGPEAFKVGAALAYLFLRPGLLAKMTPALLSYLAPGFHPWRHDNRPLVQASLRLI
jgi:hypothetical protein